MQFTCGILGATGIVGQRFVSLLENHEYLVVTHLGASEKSAGKLYRDCVKWKVQTPIPDRLSETKVTTCHPDNFRGCDIIFSASSEDVAGELEEMFLKRNFYIFSNAKNFRMHESVPLIVPLVNSHHFAMIRHQQAAMDTKGFLITNANCSTTGIVLPLKALRDRFGGLSTIHVVTMQAASGGGYPGVASMDILDNVVPFIPEEEEKIERETMKILGDFTGTGIKPASISISAQCNRVPVTDGHLACVSVNFTKGCPNMDEILSCFRTYQAPLERSKCPSAPRRPIRVHTDDFRPQPRLDREIERGYGCSIGRIRRDTVFDLKFVVLTHNTVLGAAGSGVLLAEHAVSQGYI